MWIDPNYYPDSKIETVVRSCNELFPYDRWLGAKIAYEERRKLKELGKKQK